ncbi:MAG: hypothetical protein ACLUDU_03995 [Butyricimonas faecihominis]
MSWEYFLSENRGFAAEGDGFFRKQLCGGVCCRSWFGYKMAGVNPMTGGMLVYTGNGDATLDLATAQGNVPNSMVRYLGQKFPPYVGGFSTSVNFKQFVFSANFEYKAGHKIMSFTISTG